MVCPLVGACHGTTPLVSVGGAICPGAPQPSLVVTNSSRPEALHRVRLRGWCQKGGKSDWLRSRRVIAILGRAIDLRAC